MAIVEGVAVYAEEKQWPGDRQANKNRREASFLVGNVVLAV
ncbi:MAG: hypothetical protein SPI30_01055 [Prevotella sp.]|nr:hypothetical protein [Prevotella sp.]